MSPLIESVIDLRRISHSTCVRIADEPTSTRLQCTVLTVEYLVDLDLEPAARPVFSNSLGSNSSRTVPRYVGFCRGGRQNELEAGSAQACQIGTYPRRSADQIT